MTTEDIANVLLRYEGGARGSLVVSQVSTGRKNSLRYEVDGSAGALAWDGERHEELWVGRRDAPNEVLLRNPGLMHPGAAQRTQLPVGHAEGFAARFASSIEPSTRTSPAEAVRRSRLPDLPRRPRREHALRRRRTFRP